MSKHQMANYGLDMLADDAADDVINTKLKANPAYTTAKKIETKAKTALAGALDRTGETAGRPHDPGNRKKQRADPRRPEEDRNLQAETGPGRDRTKKHREKLPASQIDPAATRAILHINRRRLQRVLRLLAANAEHYLARHLNAYLDDGDEYRAITRETIICGLAGTIAYSPKRITVTLDRPGQGRVARALALLLAEIITSPPALPGDGRPITYALRQ